jgi:peptide chain release factor
VRKALTYLIQEAAQCGVRLDVMEQLDGYHPGDLRSVLVALEGERADALAHSWQGSVQWTCRSPYRPTHRRKNWFISGRVFTPPTATELSAADIRYEALRASGPGGQHVNTTDSAVRAVHGPTGLSVKVQTERSQHANKRLARELLLCKLASKAQEAGDAQRALQRAQHHQLERGNPARLFIGERFACPSGTQLDDA